jgi:protein phosphatase
MATQQIQAFSMTDTGLKRSNNQDACAVFKKEGFLLMVVADGVGGNMCGEVASRLTVATLHQRFKKTERLNPKTFLAQAAQEANQNIRDYVEEHPECKGMATTLTAAIIQFPNLHLLQIGDSRAYLFREKTLRPLTEDQTLVRKMVKEGLLTIEEARTHPKRHVIVNALGITPNQTFDYFHVTLKPNDQILLCSDGLHDEISEQQIGALLLNHSPKEAIQKLIAAANEAGGKDNISVTLAVINGSKMEGTKQFDAVLQPEASRKFPLKWLIILLCLFALAGGTAWYLGQSTELGKKAGGYISSLLGKRISNTSMPNTQGEKP